MALTPLSSDISWISGEAATCLLVIKGVMSLIGVLLLLYHIDERWESMKERAQKARFYLLLGYAVLSAASTYEQLEAGNYGYRNLGGLILSVGLVIVVIMSMREWRRSGKGDY